VFLIFLAACRDRHYFEAATSSMTIGTGDQDDAVGNMTATELEVSNFTEASRLCVLTLNSICRCKSAYRLAKRVAWRLI
jgi:hypothetical protein